MGRTQKGNSQFGLLNYEDAFENYKLAISFCTESSDSLWLGPSHEQAGAMSTKLNHFEQAEYHFGKAKLLIQNIASDASVATFLNNFGIMYSKSDQPDKAIPYFKRAIESYRNQKLHKEESKGMNNQADAYRRLGKFDMAISIYEECLEINRKYDISESLIPNYSGLYEIANETGDYRSAAEYLSHFFN